MLPPVEEIRSLSIIGCGQVGTVLGALWHSLRVFRIEALVDSNFEKARRACALIGAGTPQESIELLPSSDVVLLSVPDAALSACLPALYSRGNIKAGAIVCHCSGSVPAEHLGRLRELGAHVASMHPVRSFADFRRTIESFSGTYCGFEGDAAAKEVLLSAFTRIGAIVFTLDPAKKMLYHSGAVFVCNYLTALLEVGLRAYEHAGVARETAFKIIEPIVRGTVDNIFASDPAASLSGPLVRGDAEVLRYQLHAVAEWDERAAALYRLLGAVALELVEKRAVLSAKKIEELRAALQIEG